MSILLSGTSKYIFPGKRTQDNSSADFKIGRVPWIIQMGPLYSEVSLKVEGERETRET